MAGGAAVLDRIGAQIAPNEFDELVEEALQQILPARPLPDPRSELSASEIAVLEEGGFDLEPRALDKDHPLVRTAALFAALIASSLSVPGAAEILHVDPSRIRQRLGERTLYGSKQSPHGGFPASSSSMEPEQSRG